MYLVAATFARPYDGLALGIGSWKLGVLSLALLVTGAPAVSRGQSGGAVRNVTWSDLVPLHGQLQAAGLSAHSFPAYVQRVHDTNVQRVVEGDLDHLVFYFLQSAAFTKLPPIEPALSAKLLVDGLSDSDRQAFLGAAQSAAPPLPAAVRARIAAFVGALDGGSHDERLAFFQKLVQARVPERRQRQAALGREYLRAMRFVYEKEFVAQRSGRATEDVAELYRTRGLSTDTAVEAGFLVHEGLGILKALDGGRRIRRVLLVGPGLDLAPRTALADERPPESYQPWAVIDALVALGLSNLEELEMVAADINPRVVDHLRRRASTSPALTLISEIQPTDTITLSAEYREYFTGLGSRIGETAPRAAATAAEDDKLRKTVRIRPAAARALRVEALDIVTERLTGPPFDLVIATNILPYFGDRELMMALSNVSGMLAPGGAFVHNEARPALAEITRAVGLPVEQSRHAIIATVRGSATPLFDSVWLHRRIVEK